MATSGVAIFVFFFLISLAKAVPSRFGQKEFYDEVRQLLALTSNGLPNSVRKIAYFFLHKFHLHVSEISLTCYVENSGNRTGEFRQLIHSP